MTSPFTVTANNVILENTCDRNIPAYVEGQLMLIGEGTPVEYREMYHKSKLKAEYKIAVCFHCIEISATTVLCSHIDRSVYRYIVSCISCPLMHGNSCQTSKIPCIR